MTAWSGSEGRQAAETGRPFTEPPQLGSDAALSGACGRDFSLLPIYSQAIGARRGEYLMGARGPGQTWLTPPQSSRPKRKCAVMEGMRPRVNQEQGEPHVPHLSPQKEGFSEGLWGSMRLMPFQSLSSFGEHPRSQKETFDLALVG